MPIDEVVLARAIVAHDDDRRTLYSVFNGEEFHRFRGAALKWFEFKKDCVVAKHYHEYAEIFCVVAGEDTFELVDVDTGERQTHCLRRGDILLVPRRVAHRCHVKEKSIVIAANEVPYISPRHNDIAFDFGTLDDSPTEAR